MHVLAVGAAAPAHRLPAGEVAAAWGRKGGGPGGRLRLPDTSDPTLCGRFFINSDSNNDYDTKAAFPSFMYPEDGNRFFPGTDASAQAGHLGGDTWRPMRRSR